MLKKSSMKLLVEIVGESGIIKRKKYPVEGDSVVIRKGAKGRGKTEYRATFTKNCLLPYHVGIWPFKRLKQKLILKNGASKCVDFYTTEGAEIPLYDRPSAEKLFEANVIRAAGETTQKVTIPAMMWVFLIAILGLNVISLLIVSGRVRIA